VGSEVYLKGFNNSYDTRGFVFSIKGLVNIPYADVTATTIQAVSATDAQKTNLNAKDMLP
jgi:hypothetical protein